MHEKRNLTKHASLTTVANLSHALAQWLLLVIIVKQFNDEVLGNLVLSLSIASPLFLLFSFKLRSLIVTDYHNETKFEQYLHTRLVAQALILLLIFILTPFLLAGVPTVILFSVLVFKVSDGISELCYSYLHRQQAFSKVAKTQILRSIFATTALLISSQITRDITYTFIAWAGANLIFAFIDIVLISKLINKSERRPFTNIHTFFSAKFLKGSVHIAKTYWLIGVSIMFGAMFMYLPNYAIEFYLDRSKVGQFAAISYFLVAGGIFINSLSQAVTPKLSALYNNNQHTAFIRLTKQLMFVGALIGLIGLAIASFIGEWILALLYSQSIAAMHLELQLVLAASLIRYSYIFLGSALNVLKCFNQQVMVYGSGTVTLAIALLVLVPLYQTIGVGIAMIIACSVEFLIMIVLFKRKWHNATSAR